MNSNRVDACEIDSANPNARKSRRLREVLWITIFILGFVVSILIPVVILTVTKTSAKNKSAMKLTTREAALTSGSLITETSTIGITTASQQSTGEERTKLTTTTTTAAREQLLSSAALISNNTKWKQHADTVAGGNGYGNDSNQFNGPYSVYVDADDQSIYVTDRMNNRVVQWRFGETNGRVVAGGGEPGEGLRQLDMPTDAILDKKDKALIICDHRNIRVMRWSRENSDDQRVLIKGILCRGLAMDEEQSLYVSSGSADVKRWRRGETVGKLVAGGHGEGSGLNQLSKSHYIFVDKHQSVYIADHQNGRVMKWIKNATEGIVVVPRRPSEGNGNPERLPICVLVDATGNVYITETKNSRVTRWSPGALEGTTVVGREQSGSTSDRLSYPYGMSFDRNGNLYVADLANHRIQKFSVDYG